MNTATQTITVTGINASPISDSLVFNISNVVPLLPEPTLVYTVQQNSFNSLQSTTTVALVAVNTITYTLAQTSTILGAPTELTLTYTLTASTLTSNIAYLILQIPQ